MFCVYKTKTFKVKVRVFQICLAVCKSGKQIPKATFLYKYKRDPIRLYFIGLTWTIKDKIYHLNVWV